MKKLLTILVLGLLWGGNVYADNILLFCKYVEGGNYYLGGKYKQINRASLTINGYNPDKKYLINAKKETILEESSGEFVPLGKYADDYNIKWRDYSIIWEKKYYNPTATFTYTLDRSKGELDLISDYAVDNPLRKNTGIYRSKDIFKCNVTDKKF